LFASKGSAGAGTGDLLSTNNLSDVADAATARANLGLGTVSIESIVPISQGGTGATTASSARTALGLGTAAVVDVIDEDDFITNSSTRPPSQQSVKALFDTLSESSNGLPVLDTGNSVRSRIDTLQTNALTSYVTAHSFAFIQNGTIRISCAQSTSSGLSSGPDPVSQAATSTVRVVRTRNGTPTTINSWTNTSPTSGTSTAVNRTVDVDVLPGDLVEVQYAITTPASGTNGTARIQNIRFSVSNGTNLYPGSAVRLEGNTF
jgi:hypothetical protein